MRLGCIRAAGGGGVHKKQFGCRDSRASGFLSSSLIVAL